MLPQVENKKILNAVHDILAEEAIPYKLTQAQMDELDRREQAYLNGEGKSYSWNEVKSTIRKKKILFNVDFETEASLEMQNAYELY